MRWKGLLPTDHLPLRAADRLKELIDEVENSNGQDVACHIDALEKILSGDFSDDSGKSTQVTSEQTAKVVDEATPSVSCTATKFSESEITQREFLVECFDNLE